MGTAAQLKRFVLEVSDIGTARLVSGHSSFTVLCQNECIYRLLGKINLCYITIHPTVNVLNDCISFVMCTISLVKMHYNSCNQQYSFKVVFIVHK